ncbi:hypothetical protein DYD21_04075 [Rhodohalobacter sp. SW132]|uniref:hypothetical protein n=1 Tax=Rhodohalobacter sp. SW132 TaxID=2293433 RepID=UPI000E235937|nr:hypothetical protein [Rhodohalobacter sp. SW132]REL39142.1 hypothetical protein DYD21_04075 [Rhodohalobacter sp. SW132]
MRILLLMVISSFVVNHASAQYGLQAVFDMDKLDVNLIEAECDSIIINTQRATYDATTKEPILIGPILTRKYAECYFRDRDRILRSAALFFQDDTAILGVETFSDIGALPVVGRIPIIGKLFGYGRYGVGLLVQGGQADSLSQSAANAQFMDGGGNISFYYAAPVVSWRNGPSGMRRSSVLDVLLAPRFSTTVSGLNTSTNSNSYNFDLAADIRLDVLSFERIFDIKGALRTGYAIGSSDFYEAMGTAGPFGYLRLEIALDIASQYRLRIRNGLSGPKSLTSTPISIGLQLMPRVI